MRPTSHIAIIAIILISSMSLNAQRQDGRHKRPDHEAMSKSWEVMQAYKISYLENNMNLTEEEAERFWPLYHEFERKKKRVFKEMFELFPQKDEVDTISDEKIEEIIKKKLDYDQELLDLEKGFYDDLFKTIPVRKIGEYFKGEKEYKRHLIGRMPPGPGNRP